MNIEIWKPVCGYEGLYEVSNLGNVKSLTRTVTVGCGAKINKPTIIMKKVKNRNGYFYVTLSKDGETKKHYIHRIVAESFIPKKEGADFVNHIDYNRKNNNVENLEWVTPSENSLWSAKRMSESKKGNKLSESHKQKISKALKGKQPANTGKTIEKKTNTGEHHISKTCLNGKYVMYQVGYQRFGKRIRKSFSNLEDAISYRDFISDILKAKENQNG